MKVFDLRQKQICKLRDYAIGIGYNAGDNSDHKRDAAYYSAYYALEACELRDYVYYEEAKTDAHYAASYASEAAPTYAEEVKAKVERNYCLIEILRDIKAWFLYL